MKDIQILFTKNSETQKYQPGIGLTQYKKALEYRFKPYQTPISGKSNLAQRVIKILITAQGSNKFYPAFGTSIQDLFAALSAITDVNSMRTILEQLLVETESIVKTEQNFFDLTIDETLDKLELVNVYFDKENNRWAYQISIKTLNGTAMIVEM